MPAGPAGHERQGAVAQETEGGEAEAQQGELEKRVPPCGIHELGQEARKKMATLGFRIPVTLAWARRRLAGAAGPLPAPDSAAPAGARSARRPTRSTGAATRAALASP